jgi:hypothetical protein
MEAVMADSKTNQSGAGAADVGRDQRIILTEITVAAVLAVALWLAVDRLWPPIVTHGLAERLAFALKCVCVATLFCFVMGVEAVAHERLRSPAIDPLAGFTTRRITVNLRYLQQTVEQLAIFAAALLGFACYAVGVDGMRAVAATTVVWIVARIAFWIGYHLGAPHRAVGAPGMALGMLLLVYVCARFGAELAGPAGAAVVVALFVAAEAFLLLVTGPRAGDPPRRA